MEQEAIVSRIWALGAEAGHRSHEGANAHSALVDWSWPYPQPPAEPHVTFPWLSHAVFTVVPPLPPCLPPLKPAVLMQRGWDQSIAICMVAITVSDES